MTWDAQDLTRVGGAEELQVSSPRKDGSDRPFVTIWTVRAGDDLYIRSAYGPDNPWYRRARHAGIGRIRAGGVDKAVTFTPIDAADTATQEAVDAAYHAKYDRFGPQIVGTVTGAASHATTLRIDPR
jgi:hypothetical protein